MIHKPSSWYRLYVGHSWNHIAFPGEIKNVYITFGERAYKESGFLNVHCHPSCNCTVNNVCSSCVDPNSTVDGNKRSCPCNAGHYTSTLAPFKCARLTNTDASGNELAIKMDPCELEIGLKTKGIVVNTDCHFD